MTTEERTEDGIPWINAVGDMDYDTRSGVNATVNHIAREVANWVDRSRTAKTQPSIFNRVAYVAPENPFQQMLIARTAVENDDIIGGVCDVTEGLAFQGLKWESEDPDTTDIFNQINRDLNLDEFVRTWHREEFTYSQVICGFWWGPKEYKIRTKTPAGKQSKKTKTVWAPLAATFLDPTKVVALRPGPFGQDRLAWHATQEEFAAAMALADGTMQDPVLQQFTAGPVLNLDRSEEMLLAGWGINTKRLLYLNPNYVFRYCRTKSTYERMPSLRLKSTFALLDLKQQLIEADRVALVGQANFILLVRQGTDQVPAKQEEIDNLKENFKVIAKLPVIIGDHRLQVDIIVPPQEFVLTADKYDTLDRRILSRTLGALTIPSSGQRNETSLTVARGVARLLENRRHMMKRVLEERLARAVVEHPLNDGIFKQEPNLTFTPRNVQLDSDAEVTSAILALRTQNELSRESTLEYFGFDQNVEALRREIEEEQFDDIFKTMVPFSAAGPDGGTGQQQPEAPQVSGARGGRPKGGGDSPQSPQGKTGPRSASGQKSPK
ncbi:hypothetical protein GCM10028801_30870 [Nocardioides maradonensis]